MTDRCCGASQAPSRLHSPRAADARTASRPFRRTWHRHALTRRPAHADASSSSGASTSPSSSSPRSTRARPPALRTKWTRRVPHPVLIGRAVCLVQAPARRAPATRPPRHRRPLCVVSNARVPPRSPAPRRTLFPVPVQPPRPRDPRRRALANATVCGGAEELLAHGARGASAATHLLSDQYFLPLLLLSPAAHARLAALLRAGPGGAAGAPGTPEPGAPGVGEAALFAALGRWALRPAEEVRRAVLAFEEGAGGRCDVGVHVRVPMYDWEAKQVHARGEAPVLWAPHVSILPRTGFTLRGRALTRPGGGGSRSLMWIPRRHCSARGGRCSRSSTERGRPGAAGKKQASCSSRAPRSACARARESCLPSGARPAPRPAPPPPPPSY